MTVLQIRRSRYRGKRGWLLCGRAPGHSFSLRVFDVDREKLERCREVYRDESLTPGERGAEVSAILLGVKFEGSSPRVAR